MTHYLHLPPKTPDHSGLREGRGQTGTTLRAK
eukprot:CAMPEP_0204275812 /NCGR_PEP_ID=MMETSP0468-20130131/26768_1 /ASSEMBLY_ACC=CAM_ASM_000383 /TAXON_ID=2969 /ORGANISM="Oxyrrhis marina" /LENGTH=31 /DNA_ID= /DNA_START= /DNA_END= /DNA_ORIENTATION=